jgi:hypothetical protein
VLYDPSLLSISGASLAPGMPSDWSITTNLVTNGIFKITISGVTTLSAGARDLISLNASVPSNAPYGHSEAIRFQNLSVNGGFIPARADSAIHKAAYFGDASGNGSLDGFDSSLISRVVVALDSGFDRANLTDPVIVADVNSNGVVDGLDAAWVAMKSLLPSSRPEIPNLPPPPVAVFSGVDPTFAMPTDVPASPGGSALTSLSVTDSAAGLIGFNINVDYSTSLLDIDGGDPFGSDDITMGSLFTSAGGWSMLVLAQDGLGHIGLSFYRTEPMTGGTGSIADINFHIPLSAPSATATLDVNGVAGSENGLIYTYVDGSIIVNGGTPQIHGTAGDDSFYIRHSGSGDMIEVYNGTSSAGIQVYSAPANSLSSLNFNTGAGNDRLIVDLVNGTPIPSGGLSYDAGADTDALTVIGAGSGAGAYVPAIPAGSGNFNAAGSAIAFTGVEPITASNFASLSITTPSSADVISIDSPAPGQNRISGTSGGTSFPSLTFFDIGQATLDTSANDAAGGGDDSITITSGIVASGLDALLVKAGGGTNVLAIQNGAVPLRAVDGENLNVSVHNDAVLNLAGSQRLRSLELDDIARASVGPNNNIRVGTLTISAGATMDVGTGELLIDDGASFSTIRSYIRNARNTGLSGLWSGNGLTSSFTAANPGRLSVASVVNASGVFVRAALIGDLNLDNSVSIADFLALAGSFNSASTWATGDLNYDDITTIADFLTLAGNFGQTYSGLIAPVQAFAAASVSIVADAEEEVVTTTSTTIAPETRRVEKKTGPSKKVVKKTMKKAHSRASRHHRPTARIGLSRRP